MHKFNHMHKRLSRTGFTIVELLVVIVIIGILASIVFVGYSSVTSRATITSLQSDLTANAKKLSLYFTQYSSYPLILDANFCPATPTATTESTFCLSKSGSTTLTYSGTSTTFSLHAQNGSIIMKDTESTQPLAVTKVCPVGFIAVPGSSTYGTSDFCVMKYEAKADRGDGTGDTTQNTGYDTWPANTHGISSSRKLVSTPTGYPVANISQTTAISASASTNNISTNAVYDCLTGCHLITEAEWMTIAQNVLSNPVNWSGGSVGSGYIYSGHNDNAPSKALQADNGTDGYANTGNTAGSNQKRTLTLTNGEVIWDLAGNVWEWTTGQTTGGQPGASTNTGLQWTEWPSVNVTGSLAINPFPSGTGLSGASTWNSTNGIGKLVSYTADTSLRGFLRGGIWDNGSGVGVLTLLLNSTPTTVCTCAGLRLSR